MKQSLSYMDLVGSHLNHHPQSVHLLDTFWAGEPRTRSQHRFDLIATTWPLGRLGQRPRLGRGWGLPSFWCVSKDEVTVFTGWLGFWRPLVQQSTIDKVECTCVLEVYLCLSWVFHIRETLKGKKRSSTLDFWSNPNPKLLRNFSKNLFSAWVWTFLRKGGEESNPKLNEEPFQIKFGHFQSRTF